MGSYLRALVDSDILNDQLQAGLELYRQRKVKKILLSGGSSKVGPNEVNAMVHWLKSRGAPKTALKLDYQGLRMRSSMINTYNHFAFKDLIVVTQSFDLARSLYLTEKIGISIGLAM